MTILNTSRYPGDTRPEYIFRYGEFNESGQIQGNVEHYKCFADTVEEAFAEFWRFCDDINFGQIKAQVEEIIYPAGQGPDFSTIYG